jgi:hypothetical protein
MQIKTLHFVSIIKTQNNPAEVRSTALSSTFSKLRWIIIIHMHMFIYARPPLLSSDQSSWLKIQRSWFSYQRYQIFWEIVGQERGPLSLVSKIEELLDRKSSSSGLESANMAVGNPSSWPRGTLYPQKLAVTSSASGCRSVGIVHSRTQATEFFKFICEFT